MSAHRRHICTSQRAMQVAAESVHAAKQKRPRAACDEINKRSGAQRDLNSSGLPALLARFAGGRRRSDKSLLLAAISFDKSTK